MISKQDGNVLKKITSGHANAIVWLLLALIVVALTIPVALNGYLTGHDYPFHIKWANSFIQQFWQGDLYPHWLIAMNADQGSPTFFFYGPVAYWITAMLPPWTAASLESTASQLGHSAWLAVFLSGVTMHLWLRRELGALSGLVGAATYIILPYHVLIDVYQRFAFSELWAFVWFPLLFLCADRIIQRQRYGVCGFALVYALLIMTHLPSTLIFSPLPALYLVFRSPKEHRKRIYAGGMLAYLFGISLSMAYLLPAMTMQSHVNMSLELWNGYYKATANFLFYGPKFSDSSASFWRLLTNVAWVTVIVGLLSSVMIGFKTKRAFILFWMPALLLTLFMMHPFSTPIWKLVKTLQAVQFPWRFNVVLTFIAAVLSAYGFQAWHQRRNIRNTAGMIIIVLLLVAMWPSQFKPMIWNTLKPFHPRLDLILNLYDADEYRPISVPIHQWLALKSDNYQEEKQKKVLLAAERGSAQIRSWKPRKIGLEVSIQNPVDITLRQLYFPGWEAHLENGLILNAFPTSDGWVGVHLPPGHYQVNFVLEPLPTELWGRWISGISFILLMIGLAAPWVSMRLSRRLHQYQLHS